MPTSVLVVYATRAGSTQEVAEAVASAPRDTGLAVDIQPLHEAKPLEGYQAVGEPRSTCFGGTKMLSGSPNGTRKL